VTGPAAQSHPTAASAMIFIVLLKTADAPSGIPSSCADEGIKSGKTERYCSTLLRLAVI
jgi:hypothetical protein